MYKTLCFISFLLVLHVNALAQKRVPGYYISLGGDTVSGYFTDFTEWNHNPSNVKFESSANELHVLTVQNCKSFSVSGYDEYLSMHVSRMTNANKYSGNVGGEAGETFDDIRIFARVVYNKNEFKLFEFKDKRRENYFYQQDGGAITELMFRVYMGEYQVIDDKKYVRQLHDLFSTQLREDKKLAQLLPRLHYTEDGLVSFLSRVHKETKTKNVRKYPADLFLIGGASLNSFKVTPYRPYHTQSAIEYKSSVSPLAGIGFVSYSQRNFGKNLYAVHLKNYSFKNTGTTKNGIRYEYKANVTMLSLGFGRKWINTPNLSWYTSFTPSAVLLSGNKETRIAGDYKTVVKGATVGHMVGMQTGVGFRKFGVWGLYNIGALNLHSYLKIGTLHNSFQAGIDWKFKRGI